MRNPDPVLVQHYAVLKGISHEEARDKLRKNYEVEVAEIPLRDLVLRTLTGMRQVVPKVEGMAQREQGTIAKIRQLEHGMTRIANQLEMDTDLRARVVKLEDELKRYKDELQMSRYGRESISETLEDLKKEIEYLKLPWYKKLLCKIKKHK